MKTINDVVKKIKRLRQLGKSVIIFLGAGASASAGIPTASEMVTDILNNEDLAPFLEGVSSTDYFDIMAKLDPAERKRFLKNYIDKSKINETHLIIGLLIIYGYVDCVLTTNFDPLIKRALILLNEDIHIYDVPNNVNLIPEEIDYPVVFHLHGSVHNVWQFNTIEELQKKSDEIKTVITKIAPGRSWIIVGYSGGDEPVFETLCDIEKFDEGLFWIGYQNNDPPANVEESILSDKTKNAHFISGFNSDSFFNALFNELIPNPSNEIVEFLENIDRTPQLKTKLAQKIQNRYLSDVDDNKNNIFIESRVQKTTVENKIYLTKPCKNWIEAMVTKSVQYKFEPRPVSIGEKIIAKIAPKFFSEQRVIDHVRLLLKNEKYDSAIKFLSANLEASPVNPYYLYYYGVVFGEKAQKTEDPKRRKSHYEKLLRAFKKAEKYFKEMDYIPTEYENYGAVYKFLWSKEHNRAIKLVTDESLKNTVDQPVRRAIAHLENATLIQPNSALSWSVLSQLYYMDDDIKNAIKALERAHRKMDSIPAKSYMRLADYYRIDNQPQKSLKALKEAQKEYSASIPILEKMADAYMAAGEQEQAFELLQNLIEQNPDNPRYHLVLGTQYYQTALQISDTVNANQEKLFTLQQRLKNAQGAKAEQIKQQISKLVDQNAQMQPRIEELTGKAVDELNEVVQLEPDNAEAYNTLGIVYQNKAAELFELRNRTKDNEEAAKYDQQAKDNLREAMGYYEKATGIDPDNQEYWKALIPICDALGFEQKANEARKKAENNDNEN